MLESSGGDARISANRRVMVAPDAASSSGHRESQRDEETEGQSRHLERITGQHHVLAGPVTICAPPTRCRDTAGRPTVFATRAMWRMGMLPARERSGDSWDKASEVSVGVRAGLWGNSNESLLEKRRGVPTRVEFDEDGERGNEGAEDKDTTLRDAEDMTSKDSELDAGCQDRVREGAPSGISGPTDDALRTGAPCITALHSFTYARHTLCSAYSPFARPSRKSTRPSNSVTSLAPHPVLVFSARINAKVSRVYLPCPPRSLASPSYCLKCYSPV